MYQQTPYGALPVPFDQVLTQNFFPTAPNLPVNFNFQSLPQMQQFNPLVAGVLIKVVQDNAPRNPLRIFTANMLSQNRWVNPEFERAFLAVSDYAMVLLSAGQFNGQVEQAVLQAANQVASCLAAIYAQQYPNLMAHVPPQQQQELGGLLATYQQIANGISQMRQQAQGGGWQQQPQQMGWQQQQGGWPQQQQQFQQPRGAWANGTVQQQQQFQQNSWPQQQQPQGGWPQNNQGGWNNQQNNGWNNQNQHHNTAEAVVTRDNERNSFAPAVTRDTDQTSSVEVTKMQGTAAIMEEWGQETQQRHGNTHVPTRQGAYVPQEAQPVQQAQSPVSEVTEPKRMTVIERLDQPGEFFALDLSLIKFMDGMGWISQDMNRMWDQVVLESGEEVRPAHSSGWKVDFDPAAPYGTYYDPEQYIKFHIRKINPDGSTNVREKLIKIEEGLKPTMQYINHEIRKNVNYRLPDDVKVAEIPWAALTREALPADQLKAHKEEQAKLEDGQEPTPVDILSLKLTKACHSFEEAELNYHKELICHEVSEELPVEYSFRKVTPLFLSKPHLARLAELRQCETLEELASVMADTDMDPLLVNKLNTQLTEAVNEALAFNLGFGTGVSIDNFIADVKEMLEGLADQGYTKVAFTINKERYASMVLPILDVLTGEEQSAYLNQLIDGSPKEQRKQYQNVLSLVENNVVVHLPGVFGPQFLSNEALQITRDVDEALLNAIRASVGRHHGTDSKGRVKHHYFVDSLGTVLEVHRGWLVPGALLVRRVTAL